MTRSVHDLHERAIHTPFAMIRLDAAGTVVTARAVNPGDFADAGLARHRGRWGVALRLGSGALSFVPLEGERYAPEPLPDQGARLPTACGQPLTEDETVVRFGRRHLSVVVNGAEFGEHLTRVDLVLHNGVWCTQRVMIGSYGDSSGSSHPSVDRIRVAASGGVMYGELALSGNRRALRCEVRP